MTTELSRKGKGAYVNVITIYGSLTGTRRIVSPLPESLDQRAIVEVTGHKAHGPIPETGSVVIARVTKVMARMAAVDILCIGPKAVFADLISLFIFMCRSKLATEIDKVDMHQSFNAGDILSLGDAQADYLSTVKNDLGVVSAESHLSFWNYEYQSFSSWNWSMVKCRCMCFFWQLYVMKCISFRVIKKFIWPEMQCPLSGQTK
ncbi:hypothetical protein ARALYDRAFT_485422 [Arabidopsis lyrata subsp. lyrata]|uniref:S1 motif domain-containing protein n=1 Tax=Arabidopsis lyrata subsp. lyrata TaxID=81972 RepID=D7LTI6_ARALL|nr:hypothetical protein ARALYDRAFT_485422 [Arabidopsis lyrata subsp. lyrata]